MNRRQLLAATAATTLFGQMRIDYASEEPSLRDLARRCGLRYGAESDAPLPQTPREFQNLFIEHCDLLATRLDWHYVRPDLDKADPSREDPNIGFARDHNMSLTGGHLIWYHSSPAWFEQITDRAAMARAMSDHITLMMKRYHGQVFSWNVVNEAIDLRSGRNDGLRDWSALRMMGPDYIDHAFRSARAADPQALLVYNDHSLDMDSSDHEQRRNALLRLLDQLAGNRTPIDAIGLQSHLRLDGSSFDQKRYRDFLRQIAARNLHILITELDVFDLEAASDPQVRDRDVADMYSRFLDAALDEPAVIAVVNWGLSDKYTWLSPAYNPRYVRADGQPSRPLPFDANFKSKPAFIAIADALRRAPHRAQV